MVMLASRDISLYPRINVYLMLFKMTVVNNKKVARAFMKWSALDEPRVLQCLSYGTLPTVNVYESLYESTDHNGKFKPSIPNDIFIARDIAQKYNRAKTTDDIFKAQKILERVILHELCHWGRHLIGASDEYYENGLDSGGKFAQEAYSDPLQPHRG
jgi:hypothetical protein